MAEPYLCEFIGRIKESLQYGNVERRAAVLERKSDYKQTNYDLLISMQTTELRALKGKRFPMFCNKVKFEEKTGLVGSLFWECIYPISS